MLIIKILNIIPLSSNLSEHETYNGKKSDAKKITEANVWKFNMHFKSIYKRVFREEHQLDHVLIKTIEKRDLETNFLCSIKREILSNWQKLAKSIFLRSYLIQSAWAQNYMCTILLWYVLFRLEFRIPEWEILMFIEILLSTN